jgi:hypothetical protein
LLERRRALHARWRVLRSELKAVEADLKVIDRVLAMVDPTMAAAWPSPRAATPPGAAQPLFTHSQLAPAALETLRLLGRPATSAEVAVAMLAAKGIADDDLRLPSLTKAGCRPR